MTSTNPMLNQMQFRTTEATSLWLRQVRDELQNALENLQPEISARFEDALRQQVQDLTKEVFSRLSRLEEQNEAVKLELRGLENLPGRMTSLEGTAALTEKVLPDLAQQGATHSARLEEGLAAHQEQALALKSQVEEQIAVVQREITTVQDSLRGLGNLPGRMTSLEGTAALTEKVLPDLAQQGATHSARLEEGLAAQQEQALALQSISNTLQPMVEQGNLLVRTLNDQTSRMDIQGARQEASLGLLDTLQAQQDQLALR